MTFVNRARRMFVAVVATVGAAAIAGVSACATRVSGGEEEPQPEEQRYKGPVAMVLGVALEHGDLSAEQTTTVESLQARMREERGNKRELKNRLRSAAGQIVRSGAVDSPELAAAIDEAVTAVEERMRIGTDVLTELHATLDARQRELVGEEVRDRIAARFTREGRDHGARIDRFVRYLMLDRVQVDKLQLLREEIARERKELRPTEDELMALVDAFEGDDFAAALDAFHVDKAALLRDKLGRASSKAGYALDLLSDDQRQLLADLIERGPQAVGLAEEE